MKFNGLSSIARRVTAKIFTPRAGIIVVSQRGKMCFRGNPLVKTKNSKKENINHFKKQYRCCYVLLDEKTETQTTFRLRGDDDNNIEQIKREFKTLCGFDQKFCVQCVYWSF